MSVDVTDQVRQVIATAEAAGEPAPGRPTLVRLTGATDHQVKKALATLATAGDDMAPAVTSPMDSAPPLDSLQEFSGEPDEKGAQIMSTPGADLVDAGGEVTSVHQPSPRGGHFVAWAAFAFGSIVSVAANILAARLPPPGSPANWEPSLYAQAGAAVWPLALLLSVEVLSRVPWPAGGLWRLARYGGVGLVATGSAVISYQHIRDVLTSWGYPLLSAGVGPLVVDGLMIASGFALLAKASAPDVKP